jgi:flagellar motor switch protein FliN/FliY
MTDNNDEPTGSGNGNMDDIWAAALAESTANDEANKAPQASAPTNAEVFPPLVKTPMPNGASRDLDMVRDIPVTMSVELGRTEIRIKQLLGMVQGSVIDLEGMAGDPMTIFVNNHPVALGEVVVTDNKYGIRITEIIDPSERIQKLHRK